MVAEHDGGAVELWEDSPHRFDDDCPRTEAIIDSLFPGNPLICVAPVFNEYETGPRESFRGRLANFQFIVPSAMSKLTGITQEGKESARCLDNTGPRQYLVVEQDSGTADEQAAVIMHLAERHHWCLSFAAAASLFIRGSHAADSPTILSCDSFAMPWRWERTERYGPVASWFACPTAPAGGEMERQHGRTCCIGILASSRRYRHDWQQPLGPEHYRRARPEQRQAAG